MSLIAELLGIVQRNPAQGSEVVRHLKLPIFENGRKAYTRHVLEIREFHPVPERQQAHEQLDRHVGNHDVLPIRQRDGALLPPAAAIDVCPLHNSAVGSVLPLRADDSAAVVSAVPALPDDNPFLSCAVIASGPGLFVGGD